MRKRIKSIWKAMHLRCYDTNSNRYSRYGGRGISICDEWHDFETFLEWVLQSNYNETLTIDRIDNDRGYEPANCKWSTNQEQANNRSTNVPITIDGVTKNLKQWADEYGLKENTVRTRYYQYGWTGARLIEPLNRDAKKIVEIDGVSKPLTEWGKENNIPYKTIEARYRRGKRGAELLYEVK